MEAGAPCFSLLRKETRNRDGRLAAPAIPILPYEMQQARKNVGAGKNFLDAWVRMALGWSCSGKELRNDPRKFDSILPLYPCAGTRKRARSLTPTWETSWARDSGALALGSRQIAEVALGKPALSGKCSALFRYGSQAVKSRPPLGHTGNAGSIYRTPSPLIVREAEFLSPHTQGEVRPIRFT